MAAETFMDIHTFGNEGLLWDYENQQWASHSSVEWTHELAGFDDSAEVTSATLTIDGCGIENVWWNLGDGRYEQMDWVTVSLNGVELGQMGGNESTFDLLAAGVDIESVMLGNAEITFSNDVIKLCDGYAIDWDWHDAVYLKTSTLNVEIGDYIATGTPVVPVPGAFLLAGFGTILVGTLRRRKTI
jgi:hypothetical protein